MSIDTLSYIDHPQLIVVSTDSRQQNKTVEPQAMANIARALRARKLAQTPDKNRFNDISTQALSFSDERQPVAAEGLII